MHLRPHPHGVTIAGLADPRDRRDARPLTSQHTPNWPRSCACGDRWADRVTSLTLTVRPLFWLLAVVGVASLVGCGSGAPAANSSLAKRIGRANIGGYRLTYECAGRGTPTVILEAGYTASGLATYGQTILPALAGSTRVCTYDRAGDGTSDPRPVRIRPLTGATQARELHRLLEAIQVRGPYLLVGHSYGGMISREFAALYPRRVAGIVLIDASSEPEIPVYDHLHAGAWLDGTVIPSPNRRVDINATVRQLERAPTLRSLPLASSLLAFWMTSGCGRFRCWKRERRRDWPTCRPTPSTSSTMASATSSPNTTRPSCWPPLGRPYEPPDRIQV